MATESESTESLQQRRRRQVAAGTPIADEGDVAFGAMAGIAVLAAILVSAFAVSGLFTPASSSSTGGGEQAITTTEPQPQEEPVEDTSVDLGAASAAVSDGGYVGIQLAVDGNTIIATGEVADENARAAVIAILEDQPNVDEVIDQLTVAEPPPISAEVVITANDTGITLAGTVPSEQAAGQIRSAAAAAYPATQITDELEIVDDADSFTLTATGTMTDPDIFRNLSEGLDGVAPDADIQLQLDADAGEELNALFELDPVLFQANTNVILEPSLATLDRAAEILAAFPEAAVEIGGHTDLRGPEDENQILSKSRAEAVEAALRERGVTNQLTAVGYGETQPLFNPDDTLEKQQANRRIEFKTL